MMSKNFKTLFIFCLENLTFTAPVSTVNNMKEVSWKEFHGEHSAAMNRAT